MLLNLGGVMATSKAYIHSYVYYFESILYFARKVRHDLKIQQEFCDQNTKSISGQSQAKQEVYVVHRRIRSSEFRKCKVIDYTISCPHVSVFRRPLI